MIAVYSCNDGGAGEMCAAIEVIHAPLGIPNQETWLWDSIPDGRLDGLGEGSTVIFQIVWQMAENHWQVVDAR